MATPSFNMGAFKSDTKGFKAWLERNHAQHLKFLQCDLGKKCPVRADHLARFHDMYDRCSWKRSCPLK